MQNGSYFLICRKIVILKIWKKGIDMPPETINISGPSGQIKNNFAPKKTDNLAASKRLAFKFGEYATPIPILLKGFKDTGFNIFFSQKRKDNIF